MRKLSFLLLLLFCICISVASAQSNIPTSVTGPAHVAPKLISTVYQPEVSPNYQRLFIPQIPLQDTSKLQLSTSVDTALITTQYFDALSRPFQTVVKQVSPTKKDFVSSSLYDEFSRPVLQYLPYAAQLHNTNDGLTKGWLLTDDSAFYKSMFPGEDIYYAQQTLEASPLQRQLKTLAQGNSWGGANVGISYVYRANTTSDSVRLWTIPVSTEDDVPVTTSYYAAGSLSVVQVTDERGIKSLIYTDELGRKVLDKTQLDAAASVGYTGWLCTYYVYDEMNHLRVVIPPAVVSSLNLNGWSFSNAALTGAKVNLCYTYWYDNRGRVTMKSIPGKGKIYTAYDAFDRGVMKQDANLRATNQWAFFSYDGQSRPDTTGIITSALSKDTIIAQAARSKMYPIVTGTYTITSVTYYDDYNWVSANSAPVSGSLVTTNINSTNFNTSYNTAPLYTQPITQSYRTKGAITGSRRIIVNSSSYLWGVNIYDSYGRAIQSTQTNYTGGADVTTAQYSFNGRVLSTLLAHQKSGTNAQTHTVLTKYTYDHTGRVLTVSKNLDNSTIKTISTVAYNELGQVASKTIGSSVESQLYSYNIRGWLLGINNNYVTTPNSISNYFGETIAYDYGFTNSQLNGNIAGIKWKAAGDTTVRAYGYTYDNTNRLTVADFSQQNSGTSSPWTKDLVDFTVSGLKYDNGGNILAMKQRGLADASPVTVDSLTYQYFSNSNQLQKVTDGATATAPLGDFKDTTYTGDDYTYDANGNTLKDYNRHMVTAASGNGAVYNFLDKPDSIVITGKAGIHYYYDAAGVQLRKQVNDYTTGSLVSKNYLYINGFVYLNDTLQYLMHEEGQIRYAKKTNSTTGATYYAYEYDYFVKDHLGNVRTVLTEGRDTATYAATMESKDSIVVAATFSNVYSPVNTVTAKPAGFDTDTSNHKVALLNATSSGPMVGPSIVLKVMAGDKVQINAYAFYNTATQAPVGGTNLLTSILNVLGSSVTNSSGGKFAANEVTNINNALNPDVTQFLNTGRTYDNTRPKAYLNWVLFDNQFNYVASNSGVQQVLAGSSKQALVAPDQIIGKSGYLYVYVSNESPQNVYFDNLTVKQTSGPLQQEQAYYPHGLPMAGLSDKALLKKSTPYKGNGGTELEEDYGLQYYNALYRKYDPQIGRFNGGDAMSELSSGVSPYHFGGNNPAMFIDPTGLFKQANSNEFEGWGLAPVGLSGSLQTLLSNFESSNAAADAYFRSKEGNSGGTATAIDNGYSFTGNAAREVLFSLHKEQANADVDGNWSFKVGTDKNGKIGYWTIGDAFTYDAGMSLKGVGVKEDFVAFGDDGGSNSQTINKIVQIAIAQIGKHNWDYDKAKDNFPAGTNKCNKFVYDVLTAAGASPGTPNGHFWNKFPPLASQWANPNYEIPNWVVLKPGETPLPGDVIAEKINYSDATGHVGIVVGNGQTVSQWSSPYEIVGQNDYGFRPANDQRGVGLNINAVFRRYIGN